MVSRINVHIASHYREDRTKQLDTVLSAMLQWKNCIVSAHIDSNVETYQSSGFLSEYVEKFSAAGHTLQLHVSPQLSNTRMLTWEHKPALRKWVETASPGEDFFIYIEDDIEITDKNIRYYLLHLRTLKHHGLIPGFLRFELKNGEVRLVDVVQTEYWQRDRSLKIGTILYHANLNPYWAGFILDRALAEEYVQSRSFSPTESEFVSWNIQERSAMGLTFENPPKHLRSRIVVPIFKGRPHPDCLVWHCSNSYSAQDHPVIARLTVEQAYQTETFPSYLNRKIRRGFKKYIYDNHHPREIVQTEEEEE